jgi:hypothetical protein
VDGTQDGGPADVDEAFANLSSAIEGAEMPPDARDKLHEHALKLQEHVREGKIEDVPKDAEELLKELGDRTSEGEISASSASEIGAALEDVLRALGVSLPPPDDDGDDDDDGD